MASDTRAFGSEQAASLPPPVFPGSGLPAPEPRRRKLFIRGVAVFAIAVTLVYLTWRATFTIDLASWWVSFPFLFLEIFGLVSFALFTFSLWDVDVRPPWHPVETTSARIAVFIPTYNEDREILVPTIAAAVALEPDHETWVLDDGKRSAVRRLAAELGARYMTRAEHTHAKGGNLNHALGEVDAEFVAILDADHVPGPNFLRNTLGYFEDPRVALVQTPQDFYNLQSFEHGEPEGATDSSSDTPLYHEQVLFYRAIQPGKNLWGAAFWCGTSAVVRTAALREIGGVATSTVTEDIHTTIRFHRSGWKTVYHNEVLARGLAATTPDQFQLRRHRWGTGAMQVFRQENPLTVSGLRLGQRIAYSSTVLAWFDSWRSLGYLLVPIVVLLTGGMPIRADPLVFFLVFGATFTIQHQALRLLSRGHHRVILATVFDLVRMTPNIQATLTLLWPGGQVFQVTPKGREGGARKHNEVPLLLVALAGLSVLALVWFSFTIAGLTPFRYRSLSFACGAAFWAVANSALIIFTVARIRGALYAPERRSSVRFGFGLAGVLNGTECLIHEISLTGAQVSTEEERREDTSERLVLTLGLPDGPLELSCIVRRQRPGAADRTFFGLEFADGQTRKQARLSLALLNGQLVDVGVEAEAPALGRVA